VIVPLRRHAGRSDQPPTATATGRGRGRGPTQL